MLAFARITSALRFKVRAYTYVNNSHDASVRGKVIQISGVYWGLVKFKMVDGYTSLLMYDLLLS